MKREFILDGLDCANCAAKIEDRTAKIVGVASASVNFTTQTLTIEAKGNRPMASILEDTQKLVKNLEPHVIIREKSIKGNQESTFKLNKGELVRLGFGAIVFIIALVASFTFWLELGLFLTSYLLIGGEVLLRAAKNILRGQVFDENFLMVVATIGAFAIKEFPEAVAVMLFYQVGELFQDIAVNNSRRSISALMDIRPDYANLKIGEDLKKVAPESVNIGDIVVIKPGERIPLDGIIIEGRSTLDTSALTGESLPREVEIGSNILSGSINKEGLLTVSVTKIFGESTVAKILELVQSASNKKAPTENFITKFAKYYTPIVVFSAAALALIPPLILPNATFTEWINRALVFLVVSCPCALVISIPLSFFGGIGAASKKGILIKGSNYLEALNNVTTVVMDKTGTLTKGIFKVTQLFPLGSLSEQELLEYMAYAENYSTHPIAVSILRAYEKVVDPKEIVDYHEVSGFGIKVQVKGKNLLVGNDKLMKTNNINHEDITSLGTIVHLAINGIYSGYIVISDEIKSDSAYAISLLKSVGIKRIVMLTGDNKIVADKISQELGIDEVYSELLPQDKVEILERLEREKSPKEKIIFVGDGINDAPVLARADIGVAMGGLGSDAAIEAADIVLMTDEPSQLFTAIKVARRTRMIVWQNILFALGIKGIVLLLGAGGLATIWEAVFADVGVAVLAILNAMRVMKVD